MGKFDINNFFEQQERLLLNNNRMKVEANKVGKNPNNAWLKYLSVCILSIGIILELVILIWIDQLSYSAILWLQGIVGVCALMFLIFVAVFLFRVNSKVINNRFKTLQKDKTR